jgi:hypothetical protein
VLLAALVAACGGSKNGGGSDSVAASPVVVVESSAATGSVAPCPATGKWASCSVWYRLERSGLAPRVDSSVHATEEPLPLRGEAFRIGNSVLEIYVFADASTREREQARLDPAKYVVYPAPVPMKPVPTLITSANLIAILHSRNDHQRERVSDAITAGPPQAPSTKKP